MPILILILGMLITFAMLSLFNIRPLPEEILYMIYGMSVLNGIIWMLMYIVFTNIEF